MKKIIILLSLCLFSNLATAFQEKDLNLNIGGGFLGTRGLFGVSVEQFYSEHHALSAGAGVDFIGVTAAAGYKYFTDKTNTGKTVWDKCFFALDCNDHTYFGASLVYGASTTVTVTEAALERTYKADSKWLGVLSWGQRSIFKNNITFDAEVTYRGLLAGGGYQQTSGILADDSRRIEVGYRGVGGSLAVGYLF